MRICKKTHTEQLHSDISAVFERKQHRETALSILHQLLEADGTSGFEKAKKSAGAISRFLNHYQWSLKNLSRVMRTNALATFNNYLAKRQGRPPTIEISIDLTSIPKEGKFAECPEWMHSYNHVWGMHVVVLYICCGHVKIPWGLRIWKGKGKPSPTALACKLINSLPSEVIERVKHVHVMADAGFGHCALIAYMQQRHLNFSVGIASHRKISKDSNIRDVRKQGQAIHLPSLPAITLYVYWVFLPSRKGKTRQKRYILSTKLCKASTIKRIGRKRWKIEALFKTLKSRFAFGKVAQKTKRGILRYLCFSLLAFLFSHFQQLDTLLSRYGIAPFPDWKKLARAVQHTLFADIRLTLLYAEIDRIHLSQAEREK